MDIEFISGFDKDISKSRVKNNCLKLSVLIQILALILVF
jgi:hypothetical protein